MEFKNKIAEAHRIQSESTGFFLSFKKKYQEEMDAIAMDRTLSDEGKQIKRAEVNKAMQKALADIAKKVKGGYMAELSAAKREALKVVEKQPKPSDKEVESFRKEIKELQTHIALTPNPTRVKQMFDDFLQSIDNDTKAQLVREEFGSLAGMVMPRLSGEMLVLAQLSYRTQYDTLTTKFKGEEYREASQALQNIESMEKSTVFPSIVEDNAKGMFGAAGADILRNPERYIDAE